MTIRTSVDVSFVVEEQYIRTTGGGGLRITVGGDRLNRYVNESAGEWREWQPEYEGTVISTDLWNLLEATVSVLSEDALYHTETVSFEGTISRLVLETLGDETLRVAFRTVPQRERTGYVARAAPASACGYPVEGRAWGRAVLDAGQTFRDRLEAAGHDGDVFEPLLSDLRQQLD